MAIFVSVANLIKSGGRCILFILCFFGHHLGRKGTRMENLSTEPHRRLTGAATAFQKHLRGNCEVHNNAVLAVLHFKKIMENQLLSINRMVQPVIQNYF